MTAHDHRSLLAAPAELLAFNAQAVRTSIEVVERLTPDDLTAPTPCAGWTLQDLLEHMIIQHYGFAAASRGEDGLALWQPKPLSDDPIAEYRAAAEEVLAAFAVPGVMDRKFPLPEFRAGVPFPAASAVSFHFIDYVVHSWDVAVTLGGTVEFDADLLDAGLLVAQAVPQGESRLAPKAAFAPGLEAAGGTTLDEILAVLGRSPNWHH